MIDIQIDAAGARLMIELLLDRARTIDAFRIASMEPHVTSPSNCEYKATTARMATRMIAPVERSIVDTMKQVVTIRKAIIGVLGNEGATKDGGEFPVDAMIRSTMESLWIGNENSEWVTPYDALVDVVKEMNVSQ